MLRLALFTESLRDLKPTGPFMRFIILDRRVLAALLFSLMLTRETWECCELAETPERAERFILLSSVEEGMPGLGIAAKLLFSTVLGTATAAATAAGGLLGVLLARFPAREDDDASLPEVRRLGSVILKVDTILFPIPRARPRVPLRPNPMDAILDVVDRKLACERRLVVLCSETSDKVDLEDAMLVLEGPWFIMTPRPAPLRAKPRLCVVLGRRGDASTL